MFRSTEEKESKELLVSPLPAAEGPPHPAVLCVWRWSMCSGTAEVELDNWCML